MSPLSVSGFELEPRRPRVIQVIESEVRVGCGHSDVRRCPLNHEHEPMRIGLQYHTLDGEFLALRDEWLERQTLTTLSLSKAEAKP